VTTPLNPPPSSLVALLTKAVCTYVESRLEVETNVREMEEVVGGTLAAWEDPSNNPRLPEVLRVLATRVRPGDTIVIETDDHLTKSQLSTMGEAVAHVMPGARAVVLTGGAKIAGVLRPGSQETPS
jgi:hypothetical protein